MTQHDSLYDCMMKTGVALMINVNFPDMYLHCHEDAPGSGLTMNQTQIQIQAYLTHSFVYQRRKFRGETSDNMDR